MTDPNTVVPRKNIVFVRNGMEKVIPIAPTDSGEGLWNTIKATFGLLDNSQPALENINTNFILDAIQVADLWSDPNTDPKYRVFYFR